MSRPLRAVPRWATPLLAVAIGAAMWIASGIGGHPGLGAGMFAILAGTGLALYVAASRSETVRGLLDHRDERISGIDVRATAAAGMSVIVAVIVAFIVQIARGESGEPYTWLGAIGGVTYVGAVIWARIRG
jgi:hypothetical protein